MARTPKQIKTSMQTEVSRHTTKMDALHAELVEAKAGIVVGDTLQANADPSCTLVVTEIKEGKIIGNMTHLGHEITLRESRAWTKQ